MKTIRLLSFLVIVLLTISCSGPKESKVDKIETIKLSASGPLFEGSNTFQAEFSDALDNFLKTNNIPLDDLSKIQVSSCKVSVAGEPQNFDNFSSINIQLFSDNYPMQNVALINPIPAGKSELNLQVAEIQEDILGIFKDQSIYIVGDAILKADYDNDLSFNCDIEIEVTYKKQEDEKNN